MVEGYGARVMDKKPVFLSVKLFHGLDDDIIDWLRSLGAREKSAHVRIALRNFLGSNNYNQHAVRGLPLPMNRSNDKGVYEVYGAGDMPATSLDDLNSKIDRW